jgi:hypothetical protein
MCIAILTTPGTYITKTQFQNSWENNYNGAGFMYNDDNNKLHVVKEMLNWETLYKKYEKAREKYPNATFGLHFRISNRGVINRENCHPFKVNNELAFIHNGTVMNVDSHHAKSDTNIFNREILRKLPQIDVDYLDNPAVKQILEEFIGRSKMVFLDNYGNFSILNEFEHGGYWENGIWYSNDSHEQVSLYVDMGGERVLRSRLDANGNLKPTPDYSSRSAGYNSSSGVDDAWQGGWANRYDARDYSSGGLNSRVGKSTTVGDLFDMEDTLGYKIANGTETCECCGAHMGENELMSEHGECMECLSQMEAADVTQNAINDGYILQEWKDGTTKAHTTDEATDDAKEMYACDACLDNTKASDLTHIPEWQCTICKSCKDDLIGQGLMDEDVLEGSCYHN